MSNNRTELPFLSVNMAMTIDGKVVLPDGRWHGLTSREDRGRMDRYRAQNDALIAGVNSIANDNPNLHVAPPARSPVPVILLRNHLPPLDRNVFRNPPVTPILFVPRSRFTDGELESFRDCAMLVEMESDESAETVLHRIRGLGFANVLLEGGPTLNDFFFRADLVDRLYLTIVPYLIGDRGLSGIVNGAAPFTDFARRGWTLVNGETIGDELFLCYERRRSG